MNEITNSDETTIERRDIDQSTVLHITTSDKLILNVTRNARNEIVTKENMNKTNTNHLTDL